MSWYERLYPPKLIARRRFARDSLGRPILPRIVQRRPRHGDEHGLSARQVRGVLKYMHYEYVYGLRRIELRPRVAAEIASPWGLYDPVERIIVLYSVPAGPWWLGTHLRGTHAACLRYGAESVAGSGGWMISWPKITDRAFFIYSHVFLHELGHHFDQMFRHKRKLPVDTPTLERSAERHAARLDETRGRWYWEQLIEMGLV